MSTPLDIITPALNDIGVIPIGEAVDARFSTLALNELNAMLLLWSIEGLKVPTFIRETLIITANKASYTIGTGGDWNTARPVKFESAFIRDSSNTDKHLSVYNDLHKYNEHSRKGMTGKPHEIYYDALNPLGQVYLFLTPVDNYTLYLTSEKYLSTFSTISDTVLLPPEYLMALSKCLAQKLMPKFGKSDKRIDADVEMIMNSLVNNNVKRYVAEMEVDNALKRRIHR